MQKDEIQMQSESAQTSAQAASVSASSLLDTSGEAGIQEESSGRAAKDTFHSQGCEAVPLSQLFPNVYSKNDDLPVKRLGLSVRAFRCLKWSGIHTLYSIMDKTAEELSHIWNMDNRSLEEIYTLLDRLNNQEFSFLPDTSGEAGTKKDRRHAKKDALPWLGYEDVLLRQLFPNVCSQNDDLPIEQLDLSVRAYNCFKRAHIDSLNSIMRMTFGELSQIRSMGVHSLEEIYTFLEKLNKQGPSFSLCDSGSMKSTENVPLRQLFPNVCSQNDDLPLEQLGLSVRAFNCLKREDILSLYSIMEKTDEELAQIRNMGKRSVEEIYTLLEKLNKQEPSFSLRDSEDQLLALKLPPRYIRALHASGLHTLEAIQNTSWKQLCTMHGFDEGMAGKLLSKLRNQTPAVLLPFLLEDCDLYTLHFPSPIDRLFKTQNIRWLSQLIYTNDLSTEKFPYANQELLNVECEKLLDQYALRLRAPADSSALQTIVASYPACPPMLQNALHAALAYAQQQNVPPESLEAFLWHSTPAACVMKMLIYNELYACGFMGCSMAELKRRFSQQMPIDQIETMAETMAKSGMICQEEVLTVAFPSFMDCILSDIKDERAKDIIMERMKGETLQEIAQSYNMTRERIRQIIIKHTTQLFEKIATFREDVYAAFFQKYSIDRVSFRVIFEEKQSTWEYLTLRYEHGTLDYWEALEDESMPLRLRNALQKEEDKQYIIEGNTRIPLVRSDLEDYVLAKYCQDAVSIDTFFDMYNAFLRGHSITNEKLYMTESMRRTRMNRFASSELILWGQWQQMRYYNIPASDFTDLLDEINLGHYQNIRISTLKIYREHPQLMRHYDIRNEYELHNLLRKLHLEERFPELQFTRMPGMQFGEFDQDMYVLSKLIDLSPISATDLAQAIEDDLGFRAESILSNWFNCIDEYFFQGMYSIDYPEMPAADFERLSAALTDSLYLTKEILDIYHGIAEHPDDRMVSSYTLKRMGFTPYSGYAIRSELNAENYFKELLTRDDLLDYRDIARRVTGIQTFAEALKDLKAAYTVVEFEPYQLIHIRRLNQIGVTVNDLIAYCDEIEANTSTDEFFTIKMLRDRGCSFALDRLGFDDWFYSSLLREDSRYSFQKLGGNVLFIRQPDREITRQDILRHLMDQYDSMDVDELIALLKDVYAIVLDLYDIQQSIIGTDMYYDRIMRKLYKNYQVYFEEV